MANINPHETEKILVKVERKKPEETATEQCASIFDLRFDPRQNKDTHKNLFPQILACIAAASFHLPVGIVVAYSAILIPQLESKDSEIPVTKEQTAWIASLAVLVVPFGAFLCGTLVDKIGRLNTIRVACVPYVIGWILIATASNLNMIYIGRFLTGFAIAMGPSPAIVYITEVARPDLRGSLICTGPSMTSLGMLFVYIKGALLPWRIVAWTGILYCAIPVLLMFFWSPESPLWLCSKGRTEEALKALQFLARKETEQGLPEKQLAQMQREVNSKKPAEPTSMFMTIIKGYSKPTGYKPLFILIFLFFFQQYAGIYITIFYAVTFFEEVKSGFNPYVSTILIGLIRMLIGLLTSVLLKKFGRRTLCMCSGTGMAIVLSISGYYTWQIATGVIEHSIIPVVCILLYMSLSVIGLMSIPWTMTAELFPMEIRGFSQGFIVSLAHVIMFSALQIYRELPDLLGGSYGVQWFFAGMSLLSVLFVFIFLPETHKKMLYEIQDYFNNNTIYIMQKKKKKTRSPTNNNRNNVV
ncbi:facilitated trehalose transporter Tret1-2 homolog isoform X2 [Halyomorpha halys]|uniref:facilitated trehalose transporter Tret1-2 homolog isoform X2 n=1 Tax=Halyomorpha halys TaxID=286706 RepID=UPI0034D29BB6